MIPNKEGWWEFGATYRLVLRKNGKLGWWCLWNSRSRAAGDRVSWQESCERYNSNGTAISCWGEHREVLPLTQENNQYLKGLKEQGIDINHSYRERKEFKREPMFWKF